MMRLVIPAFVLALILSTAFPAPGQQPVAVRNGGFEEGLSAPWGTGQFGDGRPIWWNRGGCDSSASIDRVVRRSGRASLHLVNRSGFASNVYGTTQQPLTIIPGQRYRIELWAKARGLARNAAVNIIVDENWGTRPIHLRAGTYDWTRFRGDFTLPVATAQLRILIEDKGEAWLDDISISPVWVPKELEEFGDLVTGLGKPIRFTIDRKGANVPVEQGVRLVVTEGTFSHPTALEVTVSNLALSSVDARGGMTRVYGIGADRSGPLAKPVVLDIGVPPEEVTVAEKVNGQWRKVPLQPGKSARVEIHAFSTHYLAVIFRAVKPSPEHLRIMEAGTVKEPWVAAERSSVFRTHGRKTIEESGAATRAFYGVAEMPVKTHQEKRDELRRVLARNRPGLRDLPADSPRTNAELFDYLHGVTNPSSQGGYYWNRVQGSLAEIRRNVLDASERVTPGRLLDIAIKANGGDVRLGVLAANNFLKETTMGGRDFPKSEKGADGNIRRIDVPAKFANAASMLDTWRSDPVAPAGYYDKMGPLYHLFSAMVAGVWGESHFSRFAVTGENFLRTTGWEKDYPDPEKGDADLLGLELAEWINKGMPGYEELFASEKPPTPEPRTVPVILHGAGSWSVRTSARSGEGPIALIIDIGKGTISGELSGTVMTLHRGERATTSSGGTIIGTYNGNDLTGTFTGQVTFARKKDDLYQLKARISGELRGGTVTGTVLDDIPLFALSATMSAQEMSDIQASREGRARPRKRSEAEVQRDLEEKQRAEARQFSFPVKPR